MIKNRRRVKNWIEKITKSVLVFFVAFSVFSGAISTASAAATTATITKDPFRVKANASGQGYQIEVKNTAGTYLKQHYGKGVEEAGEDATNSNGSVVHFMYNGHKYLVGNKYYFTALSQASDKTTAMFDFIDNSVSGDTITTKYTASVPIYGTGSYITVTLIQKLTIKETSVKKDFDVSFNYTVQDMRLLHGGDTFFGGKDSGFPSYNPLNNSVYIVPLASGTDKDLYAGIMQFSGDTETPADYYFAGLYSTGKSEMLTGQLSNSSIPITSTTSVDGGYYLQWNRGNGSSMSIRSTERFIAESGAVQLLAPSAINAIFGSQYSADFTAFNIGNESVVVTLTATSPALETKIYDGNREVSQVTLAANETKNISVRGIAGNTVTSGALKLVAKYSYGGTAATYTAQTDFNTKNGPAVTNVTLVEQKRGTIKYTVATNQTGVPVTVALLDSTTGALVSGWGETYTPTSLTATRSLSTASLIPGRSYYLNVTIEGNLTPNRAATFIKYGDAAPVGLAPVATTGPSFSNGKITGVTADMEYRKNEETTYTKVTGTQITGLTAGTYCVRYRDTTTEENGWHLVSPDVTLVVKDTAYDVVQGAITNGTWSGDSTVTIKDTMSGVIKFIPTTGYELNPSNVTFSGTGDISVNNNDNTITISNVKKGGTINATCNQTQESIDRGVVNTEIAKLKSAITLDPLQAIDTDLYTKIYNTGENKNTAVTYAFANTTYTTGNLVSALNNTATAQTVSLKVTLTKGTNTQEKIIAVTFPKENIVPEVTAIKTKVLNGDGVTTILNNLTFGAFYNKEIEVTIDAVDANSGIKNISYQLVNSDSPTIATPQSTWTTVATNPAVFTIAPSFKGVIFTKTEDNAGNVSINSYSKMGAVITENSKPIITYETPLETTEDDHFVNAQQNISTKIEDPLTTSNLKASSYSVFKKNGNDWQEIVAKAKTNTYTFDDNKTSVVYTDLLDASGHYKVVATGEDFSGNVTMESSGYINIDVDNPTLAFTSTAPTSWVNAHTITMDVTDNDDKTNSGLYQLSVIKDDGTPEVLKTYDANKYEETGYSYNVDSEGTHTYVFELTDKAGNKVTSTSYTVLFDKTAPAFPVVTKDAVNGSTNNGKTWYKTVLPNVTITPASTEVGRSENISKYRLNSEAEETITAVKDITSLLKEGENSIEVSASDSAGNITKNNLDTYVKETLYIDTVEPEIESITTTKENDDLVSKILNVLTFNTFYKEKTKVTIKASDATSGVHSIAYEKYATDMENDPHVTTAWTTVNVATDGTISFVIEPSFKGNIYAKAIDNAGNESPKEKRKEGSLVVENTVPTITVAGSNTSSNEPTTYVKGNQTVEIKVEDTGISSWLKATAIEVSKWDGTEYVKETTLSKQKEHSVSDKTTEVNETIDINASGRYRINVTAMDQAGNEAVQETRYIFVDVDNPTLAFTSTAPTSWVSNHKIKIDLADKDSGLKKLYIDIDNGGKTLLETLTTTDTNYEYTVNTVGTHTYQFTIEDGSGNSTTSGVYEVKLDKTLLTFPEIIRPNENGNQVEGTKWYSTQMPNIEIQPVVQEADKSTRYSVVTVNGAAAIETSDPAKVSIVDQLKEGRNTIRVSAYDEAGNVATDGDKEYQEQIVYIDTESAKLDTIKLNENVISDQAIEYRNTDSEVKITASDQSSGVSHISYALCKGLDTSPTQDDWVEQEVDEDNSISLSLLEEGDYSLHVKVYDFAGNEAATQTTVKIVIDKTKPVILDVDNEKLYYTNQPFDIKEANIGSVKINDIELSEYIILADQTKEQTLLLKVTDKAGNTEEYAIFTKPISSIMAPIDSISDSNVINSHQKECEDIKKQLLAIDQTNASKEQIETIEKNIDKIDILLAKIKVVQEEIENIITLTPKKPVIETSIKDEETLVNNLAKTDALLKENNLSDEERQKLEKEKEKLQEMIDHIESLKTLSKQKEEFDKQDTVKEEDLAKFEDKIKKTINIETRVENTTLDNIDVKYLYTVLSPNEILNYEGQNIEIVMSTKEIETPILPAPTGYQKVKAYDLTIYKKINDASEEVHELSIPVEITFDMEIEADAEYSILRHHQGETEILPNLSTNKNQIHIKSTKFSTYEIMKKENTATLLPTNNNTTTSLPTSDDTTIVLWVGALLISGICIAVTFFIKSSKKKKESSNNQ